jgi:hypothetical protein
MHDSRHIIQRRSPFVALLLILFAVSVPDVLGDTTADLVLGQIDFVKNAPNFIDARALGEPNGVAIDSSVVPHRVYVTDLGNHRVLRFPSVDAFVNGEPADLVLGQADFFSYLPNRGGTVNAIGLDEPAGVAVDPSGNVFVADTLNRRVVEYLAPIVTGQAAAVVLGQPNLTTATCVISSTGLCSPADVALDALGNIYVADLFTSRVLRYPRGAGSGAAANVVIGQPGSHLVGMRNQCHDPVSASRPHGRQHGQAVGRGHNERPRPALQHDRQQCGGRPGNRSARSDDRKLPDSSQPK